MKITLTFYPSELKRFEEEQVRVVVIDVLRACSTIIHALSQGCKAIYPFASVKGCLREDRRFGRSEVVLGGERGGLRIKGFQLGNSPQEYSREVVRGKIILFTTTNCTRNLQAVARLRRTKEVLLCSFLNLPAVAERLTADHVGDAIHLALSGTDGGLSLEDVVCGGMLIHRLIGAHGDTILLSDSACIAYITYLHYKDNLRQALLDSTHGRRLVELGMEKDLDF